jgi:uncharacterized lipoprotein NlpE involved in copper resistance
MKKLINTCLVVATILVGLVACDDKNSELKPVTETQDFVYVNTASEEISVLNQWLRTNPDKKVVSFSGVLAYREGVSGFVLYFSPGDNSKQKFERINLAPQTYEKSNLWVHGIDSLQAWKDTHPNAREIAFSTVPAYSGGVDWCIVCFEQ